MVPGDLCDREGLPDLSWRPTTIFYGNRRIRRHHLARGTSPVFQGREGGGVGRGRASSRNICVRRGRIRVVGAALNHITDIT